MDGSADRVGLALSGGGFRATLFHLGVLRALRDHDGLLSRVRHIASVSGGSIIAAHVALNWSRYTGTEAQFDEAAELLAAAGIDAEVIDVQTLLPFDLRGVIIESLKKTSRVAFIDEDVPGGTTAFMMQQVLERDHGYDWLDSEPLTLPAKEHRPAYGSDGDYWSKPSRESIFESIYALMHEADPKRYPKFM